MSQLLIESAAPQSAEPSAPGPRAFVLGARLRRRVPERLDLVCLTFLAAVIALPLRGLYASTGSTMEEGFMLYFPERITRGDVPNVDFLHLYGPGSLDVLVGWYGLFGHSLASERTFGLLQHLGVIAGIYALTRAWGRVSATVCALVATFIVITPIGLSAMAWEGAIALGVWSVVFALRSYNVASGMDAELRRRTVVRCAAVAGLLAGLALTYRPDLVIALVLAHGWLLWRRHRASWKPYAIGLFVGLLPLLVHLVVAGISPSLRGMLVDPVVHLRPGRELPVPPSWSEYDGALQWIAEQDAPWWGLPAIAANRQIFLWFFAMLGAIAANLVVARRLLRTGNAGGRGLTLAMGGLFGLGILPQAMQRPDSTHLAWVTCISFSVLPVTLLEFSRWVRPRLAHRRRLALTSGVMLLLLLVVCPFFTFRMYALHARVSVGNKPVPFHVERNGREFWMGNDIAALAARELVADLETKIRPGQRLLVGPADLARTIYSDVMFYWLFPELDPATYYIEMDPGLADKEGSSLADDVRSADWIILTNYWTGWHENNSSDDRGSDAPNQVVANEFCLVGDYQAALVLLYQKCDQGSGVSPAEVGERSARVRAEGR